MSRPAQTSSRTRSTRPRPRPAASTSAAAEIEIEPTPGGGAKRTVASVIRQIPNYLRLLGGLMKSCPTGLAEHSICPVIDGDAPDTLQG